MRILGIRSKALGISIPYTDKGIDYYNAKISKVIPSFDFKEYAKKQINAIAETKQSIKPSNLKTLSIKWEEDIQKTKTKFKQANNRRDLDRLKQLYGLGKVATSKQIAEKNRLRKETAQNYQLGGELVGKIIGTSLINMGLFTAELYKAIEDHPEETITILFSVFPAIYSGVKQDFNRVMSGDPLEIGSVGLEYWTIGKVFKLAGKAFKVPVSIGRTLSPKYFNGIAKTLVIPPITLRRAVMKTSTSRKIKALLETQMKNPKIRKQVELFNKNLEKSRLQVNKKLNLIQKQSLQIKKTIINKIEIFKMEKEYKQSLKLAREIRAKTRKKGTELKMDNPDYDKAIVLLTDTANAIGEVNARGFMIKYLKSGGKLTKTQMDDFIKAVQEHIKNILNKSSDFQLVKRLALQPKSVSVKLIKQGKIKSAKIFLKKISLRINELSSKINKLSLVKKMNLILEKIKSGIKKPIKEVRGKIELRIRKYKTKSQLKKEFRLARKNRANARKKGKLINIGNDDYVKAIDFLEDFSNNYGRIRAKIFINKFKKSGGKIGLGQEENFIKAIEEYARGILYKLSDFKKLQIASKFNKPYTIKLIKQSKILSAKKLFNNLLSRIKKIELVGKMDFLIKNIKRKIKGKISPKIIKKKLEIRKLQKTAIKRYKKTVKYRLEKNIPIRKVTLNQLRKSSDISNMNRFIDQFFNEMGKRQKIDITSIKFGQMKNVIKKRMSRAIKTGNKKEISNFESSIGKLMSDMNKKVNKPDIRIIEIVDKKKKFRIIKEFEPETPKGQYVEVKVGNQIQLQRVEQVQKGKVKQVQKTYTIQKVRKKNINLSPLLRYGVFSLTQSIFKNMLKTKQKIVPISNSRSLFIALQDSAQDFKILQAVAQDTIQKLNIASAIKQIVLQQSKVKQPLKLKTIQKMKEKKKIIGGRIPTKFKRKKLSKKVPTYYVVIKRHNKLVKLLARPLRLSDAKDYLAFRIDKGLGRSAWFEPVGLTKNVIGLPKEMKGYFNKISNKLRPFRLDRGKRLGIRNGYIEKKKYIGDTKSEIRELQKARLKSKIKRKIPLKKTSKAITRLSNQRKKKSNRITTQKSKVTTKKKKVKNPTKRKTKKLIKKRKLKRKS
jgi:hypothetical protein